MSDSLRPADIERHHLLGIPAGLLDLAQVRRVTDPEARALLSSKHPGDLAGIVYPYADPQSGQSSSCRVRRDHPEIENGKPTAKYLSAYGDRRHLYFAPGAAALLADTTTPVVVVEAEKSVLALTAAAARAGRPLLAIGTGGCWGWRGRIGKAVDATGARVDEKGPLPDVDRVTWTGRDTIIVFDANAKTNTKVRAARRALAAELTGRGAKVRIAELPVEADVNGPDDLIGKHGDEKFFALLDAAVPVQPESVDELLSNSGLLDLTMPVDLDALERSLRELAGRLRGADRLRRKLARTAVLGCLEALKVKGAAQVIDAALGGSTPETETQVPALVRDDEPWPDRVDGAAVLEAVAAMLRRYLVLPTHAVVAMALWIVHTYAMLAWFVSPMLAFVSPTWRCGKTTALLLVGALARRSLIVANLTPAVLFRVIDQFEPTLISDEADTWLSDEASELRGIFNSGHTKGAATVARCVGDDHEVKLFSTWAAKAIAMIAGPNMPPSTIEDRSVLIELRRKAAGEQVDRLRLDRIVTDAEPLRRQLRRWADDHVDALRAADPVVPSALNDRAQDNWRPLLAIADVAGGPWPARARAAALGLNGAGVTEDIGAELLADIKVIFEDADDPSVLSSADILKGLVEMEDRPWASWSKGKPITGSKVARMLKAFKVLSAGTIRIGTKTARAYRREAFTDAWARYLPSDPLFKVSQCDKPNEYKGETAISMCNKEDACYTLESVTNPMNTDGCFAVTLSEGENDPNARRARIKAAWRIMDARPERRRRGESGPVLEVSNGRF